MELLRKTFDIKVMDYQFTKGAKYVKTPRINNSEYENARMATVNEIMHKEEVRCVKRAGILFYTIMGGKIWFCFGRDERTGELTDFGGGRKLKETSFECAIREANEESRYIFGEIKLPMIVDCRCLYNKNMLMVLCPIDYEESLFEVTNERFDKCLCLKKNEKKRSCHYEMSSITWISIDDLFLHFDNSSSTVQGMKPIYSRVRQFLVSCKEFSSSKDILTYNLSY